MLAGAGYRTVGSSAHPDSSRCRNLEQGFEVSWGAVAVDHDAMAMARLAGEAARDAAPPMPAVLTDEERDTLRSLGYTP